jgi:dipeptidyl aminopeptidase/acylaminoacyl peptidase
MKYLLAITLSTLAFAEESKEPRGLLPQDFYQEKTVESTALSPDASLLAYTIMTIDEEKNKRHREIWMQPLKNGKPNGDSYRFTSPVENSSSPKWSLDGKSLVFSSKRKDDKNTVWFIRVDRPGGEANHIEGIEGSPVWSPDGKWVAYTKAPTDEELEPPAEKEDEESESKKPEKKKEREGWVSPDSVTKTLNEKRFDGRVYTTMRVKRDATQTLLPHASVRNKRQLYVVPAEGGTAERITSLPYDVGGPVWTADSNRVLFTGNPLQDDEHNKKLMNEIYSVARVGGDVITLTENPGSDGAPAISPNGDSLVFLRTTDRGEPTDVMLVEIDIEGKFKHAPKNLTENWDYGPGAPKWAGGNKTIRWTSSHHGNTQIFESDLKGNIKQLTDGDRAIRALSTDSKGTTWAYSATDPTNVSEVYIAKKNGSATQITNLNADWLSNVILNKAERITWKVEDGTEIEGWVIKPVDFDPSKKYPLILKIHGGPHSAYGNYWFRTFHVLSEAGFFVFYPNPRGSSGYGHSFTYATRGKWGELDSEDYLKGVDAVCEEYASIDAKRVGVSGGSYGGYMTAWLTSTTDRFAAANPSRMIVNWESWYGTSDAQGLTEFEFFGEPWEQREIYRRLSPITYVENVTAPTLIIHSENDFRTPIGDGEQWYIALKKRSIPVEMVRYPRSSHGLSRSGEPWLLVDRLERIKSWFTHWLIEEKVTSP